METLKITALSTDAQLPYGTQTFKMGNCHIIINKEGGKHHMVISHPTRLPDWDEIYTARQTLIPYNITVATIIPARQEQKETNSKSVHLWQIEQ